MSELINVFSKLSEFYPQNLVWEQVEDIYRKAEQVKADQADSDQPSTSAQSVQRQQDTLRTIPIVQRGTDDSYVLSSLLEVSTTIRALKESSTSYDNNFNCWDQIIKVSPRDGYLAFIYALVGLGNYDPTNLKYRQLSLAASSAYFLSLTIPGAKGFHVFEEEVISVALQVFNIIEKIQSPDVAKYLTYQQTVETWVNFTSFCDDLKLMFRYIHFDEYKVARDAIIRKLVNMQFMSYEKGFANVYAVNLHGKYFEILDEVVNAHNGDPQETLLKIMNMTLFLHTYNTKPKGLNSNECEHISDWFIKTIGKFPRIVSEVLDFFIKFVVTNPEKGWKTEQIQRALDYAAKYDAALFTRCNASIVDFLSEAVYADEVGIRSRAVELMSRIILLESSVDWRMFRHEISETPREVYIIKELIDSIRDTNNNIKIKAVQAIQQALIRGSPNTKKILNEGLKYAQFNASNVELPEEPMVLKNEIRFAKPNIPEPQYSFHGIEIIELSFLYMPQHIYLLFKNPLAHVRRAAIMLIEVIVKINPLIIFNTNFVQATCGLVGEPTALVRKTTMLMVDSILATYPNCYPVIYVWCKVISPMLQDSDPKNIDIAMECFRNRVLLNIKGIDQTNQAEHFMPWVIIRTLLITQSRLYLQMSFHSALKPHMINQQIISTVESHILASNSTEAWVLLNFICGKIRSKEPDSLIHCFVSYHSSPEWNSEQNLLIALEVLSTCLEDFSYTSLNDVFKHLLNFIKSGRIIPQIIGKAFDLMTSIDHRSREYQMRSTPSTSSQTVDVPSENWVLELHNYLEHKLLEEMPNFPDNRSVYMSHLFSYSEANLHIRVRPSDTIVSFIHKYLFECLKLPESELEFDNDRIFNSMILIAGRFSIRDAMIANTTCKLYGRVLKAVDRPSIVNTILVAVADLCKKHTQVVEAILDRILEKLSSPYLMNRMETFKSFAILVLQDQLKLRGSLLLALLSVVLDESEELARRAIAFFKEFVTKKNPSLFHKCLIECPFVLNEYPNFEGLDSFADNMIRSPLKGENNRKARYKLYNHLMESVDNVSLILYFGNLKNLSEKCQNDPLIKSPEGIALIRDIFYILKRICQKDIRESDTQPQSDNPTNEGEDISALPADPKESTSTPGPPASRRGRRRDIPTLSEALMALEKSVVFVVTIAENPVNQNVLIQRSIDDLAKVMSLHFPHIIEYAQPTEFWSKYRQGKVTSTPKKRKSQGNPDDQDDEDIFSNEEEDPEVDVETSVVKSTSAKKQKSANSLEYMLLT